MKPLLLPGKPFAIRAEQSVYGQQIDSRREPVGQGRYFISN